jgi:hypothetical protein
LTGDPPKGIFLQGFGELKPGPVDARGIDGGLDVIASQNLCSNLAISLRSPFMSSVIGVKVRLGQTALKRTPSLPWSSARALVKLTIAPFEAL